MHVLIPQIALHCSEGGKNEPILTCCVHPTEAVAATGGGDSQVQVWVTNFAHDACVNQPSAEAEPSTNTTINTDTATTENTTPNNSKQLCKDGKPANKSSRSHDKPMPLRHLVTLNGHLKSVNSVRFSPNGRVLATAGDDGTISLWTLPEHIQTWSSVTAEKDVNRKALRGQACDIYDIAWSPDNSHLVSGSIDGSIWVWDIAPASVASALVATEYTPPIHYVIKKPACKLDRIHSHYVQGLCWDPFQQFFCSQSSDRTCRIISNFVKLKNRNEKGANKRYRCCSIIGSIQKDKQNGVVDSDNAANKTKNEQQPTEGDNGKQAFPATADPIAPVPVTRNRVDRLFMDESLATFFRRPAWSPDGTLLVFPAASLPADQFPNSPPSTVIFAREQWTSPVIQLPCDSKPSIVAAFSPKFYALDPSTSCNVVGLPYRMVFAVATIDSVVVYDTQHEYPLANVNNIHCAALTDVAWASGGDALMISSQDGYVSIITFANGELGCECAAEDIPIIKPLPLTPKVKLTAAAKKQQEANRIAAQQAAENTPTPTPQQQSSNVVNPLVPRANPTDTKSTPAPQVNTFVPRLAQSNTTAAQVNTLVPRSTQSGTPIAQVNTLVPRSKSEVNTLVPRSNHSNPPVAQVNTLVPRSKAEVLVPTAPAVPNTENGESKKQKSVGSLTPRRIVPSQVHNVTKPEADSSANNNVDATAKSAKGSSTPRRVALTQVIGGSAKNEEKHRIIPMLVGAATTHKKEGKEEAEGEE